MQKGQYFNKVAHPPTHDPHQFLANRDSRSKLKQYNIEQEIRKFSKENSKLPTYSQQFSPWKIYIFLALTAGFYPFRTKSF